MDFLAHDFVQVSFAVEEFSKDTFGLSQGSGLVGEICQIVSPETIYDEMGNMGNPAVRESAHRINPFLLASSCLMRTNILY